MYGLAIDRHYPFHSHTRSYDTSQGASQGVPQTSIASQNDCLFELTYKLYGMFMSKLLQPCDLSSQVLPRVYLNLFFACVVLIRGSIPHPLRRTTRSLAVVVIEHER